MNRVLSFLAACLLGTMAVAQAASPCFDCAKAPGSVEKLIWNDPALSALDWKLAAAFGRALERVDRDGDADLRAMQRGWVKRRNDCWKADDVHVCVETSYRRRIAELQIQYGDRTVPSPVYYRCGDMELAVVFYQDTDPPTAVLTEIGAEYQGQALAFLTRSGSGARYEGRDVGFWEHHGAASLTWQGKETACKVLKSD